MSKKLKTVTVLTFMLLAVGGGFAYSSYTKSPMYSLRQAQKAFDRHDSVSFTRYVDVQAIMGSFYDQMFAAAYGEQDDDFEREDAQKINGDALIAFMKPRVAAVATLQFIECVENGEYAPEQEKCNPEHVLLAIWRESGGKDIVFEGIEYIGQEGKFAHAWLRLHQKTTDKAFVLDIAMREKGGYWQVSDVWNFSEILRQKPDMEANRMAGRDMLISEAMQRTPIPEDLEKAFIRDGLEVGEESVYGLELTDLSQDFVDEHTVEINFESQDGEELDRFMIDGIEDLKTTDKYEKSLYEYIG